MTKTQAISAMIIKEYQANGGDIRKAIDSVCGEGTVMKLVSDVWEAAQVK